MTFCVPISGRSRCWVTLDMKFCFPLVDVPDTERNMHCPLPLSLSLLSLLALSSLSRIDCGLSGLLSSSSLSSAKVSRLLCCYNTLLLPPPPLLLFLPCFRFCFAALSLRTFCSIFLSRFFFPCFFLA